MDKQTSKAQRVFLVIGTIMAWFAVIFQLYLIILNSTTSIPETIIRFFSFYTILTNIVVALCFTILLLKPKSGWGKVFSRGQTLTAIAIYITVVALVYNLVLRFLWAPTGLKRMVDELLHVAIPLFFVVYWAIFVPKTGLQWKNVLPWMIYPLVYLVYILIHGAFSGFYPYPFVNVSALGYSNVLLNSGGLFFAFILLSLLFVAIGRRMSRNSLQIQTN